MTSRTAGLGPDRRRAAAVVTGRTAGLGAVAAAALGGALFAPVFTISALLPALAVSALPVLLADQLSAGRPGARAWRAPLALVLALAGLAVLTLRGVDDPMTTVRTAVTQGWQLTLASTWPARPDPELMLFVPLLTLLAAVVAVELLRSGPPLAAILPGLALGGLAQLFSATAGTTALAAGLGYAMCAALMLLRPSRRDLAGVAVAVVAVLAAGTAAWAARPAADDAVTVHHEQENDPRRGAAVNPLDQIADRLSEPEAVVFHDRTDAPVTRWPLVVLDRFDGQAWTSSARYRPLGLRAGTDAPAATEHTATVRLDAGASGPWLPTPGHPVALTGAGALIDDATGTVVADGAADRYEVTWAEPRVTPEQLTAAGLVAGPESGPPAGLPESIRQLAAKVTGDAAPTFHSALALEKWMRQNYRVATGTSLPTGHGYAQLDYFLRTSKRGTSEQFAAAYVVLARSAGIPARLVVGYRQPASAGADGSYTVTGADALAWPEVHVAGAGWVPLDPTAQAGTAATDKGGMAGAVEQARKAPDPATGGTGDTEPDEPRDQVLPPPPESDHAGLLAVAAAVLVLLLAWPVGVPLAKVARRRRRRAGEPAAAVAGACAEARDRLIDHGLEVPVGATLRELAEVVPVPAEGRQALARLGACADRALWSGGAAPAEAAGDAWREVRSMRSALAKGPLRHRARAALTVRSLRRPRR
ncbi:transglutaminaseTgpA domain-containing protein [Actinoplanes sp. NPDC049265]|uniref:transglutaminase family protein n=1 Tax=Actinoplanes sp. NPDC049265 TaxID=3363902 RepID=UPI0037235E9B